jgi:hypothetical protein
MEPAAGSRATKLILALGALLLLIAATGVFSAEKTVQVSKEDAVAIAETQIDFTAETTRVRLVRRGFRSAPYWGVSFSTPDGSGGYERLTTVLVNAVTGDVERITRER